MEKNINPMIWDKSNIRTKILKKRDQLSNDEIKMKSKQIANSLFNEASYMASKQLLIFLSYGTEVYTDEIISQAFVDGKQVYVPKIMDFAKGVLSFYQINRFMETKKNAFGIREPIPLEENQYIPVKDTLCVTPGVAFDMKKHRMGYGKGFYDRFLEVTPCKTIALCFDFQIQETIPYNDLDQTMDIIISERRII